MEIVSGGTLTLRTPQDAGALTELAVMFAVNVNDGSFAGAVYVTAAPLAELIGEILPQSGTPVPPAQATVQFTPRLAGSLATVAVNWVVVPNGTTVEPRAWTETVIAVTATVVDAEAAVSLTEVAVMLTVVCPGATEAGAVYVVGASLAVAAGETVPQAAAGHDTVQVTPRLAVSLLTVAATCAVSPGCSLPRSAGVVTVMEVPGPLPLPAGPLPPSPPQPARAAAATIGTLNALTR